MSYYTSSLCMYLKTNSQYLSSRPYCKYSMAPSIRGTEYLPVRDVQGPVVDELRRQDACRRQAVRRLGTPSRSS